MNKRPKNTKYNKYHKGRITHNLPIIVKNINQENQPNIFRYKLISLESCRLTASQIGAAELAIKRKIKSIQLPTFSNTITEDTTQSFSSSSSSSFSQQFLTLIFPQIPVTKKPAEVRMGKGKGNIDYWMCRIKMGSPIFEINFKFPNDSDSLLKNQVCKNIAKLSFDIANSKLPIKTKIIEIKKKVNIN